MNKSAKIRKAFEEEKHKQGFSISKWNIVLNQYESLHDYREYIMYKSRQKEIDELRQLIHRLWYVNATGPLKPGEWDNVMQKAFYISEDWCKDDEAKERLEEKENEM